MKVNVTLHGILRDYLPKKAKGRITLDLPDGATLEEALAALKITGTVNSLVNDAEADLPHVLRDGDEVQLFRAIGGG